PQTNIATVAGGGDINPANNMASDSVTVNGGPDLAITKTHTGNFFQSGGGARSASAVSNVGATASLGTVTVSDVVPAGLTATAISGTGWTCTQPARPCTRSEALVHTRAYPTNTVTMDVRAGATSPQVNTAT